MKTAEFISKLKYSFRVLFHPFNGFYELKYENKGSGIIGFIFLAVYFLSVTVKKTLSGYLFSSSSGSSFSIVACLMESIAPILLFCISNWCLTLLLNGEAKMGQIFTALCYALIPIAGYNLLFTALSNILSFQENLYLTLLYAVCILWTVFLIIAAVMETNQYSFSRSVVSCLLSILGIAVLLLIFLLCGDIITQIFSFIYSIIKELSYR